MALFSSGNQDLASHWEGDAMFTMPGKLQNSGWALGRTREGKERLRGGDSREHQDQKSMASYTLKQVQHI